MYIVNTHLCSLYMSRWSGLNRWPRPSLIPQLHSCKLIRGLDCIFFPEGNPCQSFGLHLRAPRSCPLEDINRYSGCMKILLFPWAGDCDPPWACSTNWATTAYYIFNKTTFIGYFLVRGTHQWPLYPTIPFKMNRLFILIVGVLITINSP